MIASVGQPAVAPAPIPLAPHLARALAPAAQPMRARIAHPAGWRPVISPPPWPSRTIQRMEEITYTTDPQIPDYDELEGWYRSQIDQLGSLPAVFQWIKEQQVPWQHHSFCMDYALRRLSAPPLQQPRAELRKGYKLEEVDSSDLEILQPVRTLRKKEGSTLCCFAMAQATSQKGKVVTGTARSNTGGTAPSHAERGALQKVCEQLGVTFYQTDGAETQKSLLQAGASLDWLYAELPPCPYGCAEWVGNLAPKKVMCSTYLADWYGDSLNTPTKKMHAMERHYKEC